LLDRLSAGSSREKPLIVRLFFVEICGKLAMGWREISDLGDRVSSQSVEVKFSNVLAKHTITAQSCGNIINLLRQLQVDLSSY
jgi:hypothetical protein